MGYNKDPFDYKNHAVKRRVKIMDRAGVMRLPALW